MLRTIDLLARNGDSPLQKSNVPSLIGKIFLKGWMKMSSYNDFFQEQMRDPEVKAEYDALEPEFSIIQAIIDARKESGLTQKELASRTGIAQADISKLEHGNANPSLRTLQRLANGMGRKLKISFC